MEENKWQRGTGKAFKAFGVKGMLLILASVEKPSPGYEIKLQDTAVAAANLEFDLLWKAPDKPDADVVKEEIISRTLTVEPSALHVV